MSLHRTQSGAQLTFDHQESLVVRATIIVLTNGITDRSYEALTRGQGAVRDLERLAEGEWKRGLRLENVPYACEQAANGRP